MKKILIALALIALFVGTAAANPYNGRIFDKAGVAPAPNPIVIHPGETLYFSYYGENFVQDNLVLPYYAEVYAMGGGAVASQMTVELPEYFTPGTSDPYVDVAVIKVTLAADAPASGQWQMIVGAGTEGESIDFGRGSRNFLIPEFPTIALPVAAILGLAFFMQRRKEE